MPRPVVVVDADVLYAGTTRAFLVHLDVHGLIRLHWSPLILREAHDALVRTKRLTRAEATRHENLLSTALPAASIPVPEVHAAFEAAFRGVRDAKDLHVAACARAILDGGYYAEPAVWLMTKNGSDFSSGALARQHITLTHPDPFLLDLWRADPVGVGAAFRALRLRLKSKPSIAALLDKLARDGQVATAAAMAAAPGPSDG